MTIIHAVPEPGSGVTPCCEKPIFELDRSDRLSVIDEYINCDDRNKKLIEKVARAMFGEGPNRRWEDLHHVRKNVWIVRATRSLDVFRTHLLDKYNGTV